MGGFPYDAADDGVNSAGSSSYSSYESDSGVSVYEAASGASGGEACAIGEAAGEEVYVVPYCYYAVGERE